MSSDTGDAGLNSVILNQAVVCDSVANALGLQRDQIKGVYEVDDGIKVLFKGDADE